MTKRFSSHSLLPQDSLVPKDAPLRAPINSLLTSGALGLLQPPGLDDEGDSALVAVGSKDVGGDGGEGRHRKGIRKILEKPKPWLHQGGLGEILTGQGKAKGKRRMRGAPGVGGGPGGL